MPVGPTDQGLHGFLVDVARGDEAARVGVPETDQPEHACATAVAVGQDSADVRRVQAYPERIRGTARRQSGRFGHPRDPAGIVELAEQETAGVTRAGQRAVSRRPDALADESHCALGEPYLVPLAVIHDDTVLG